MLPSGAAPCHALPNLPLSPLVSDTKLETGEDEAGSSLRLVRQNLHNLLKFQGLYASGKLASAPKTTGKVKNRDSEAEIRLPD